MVGVIIEKRTVFTVGHIRCFIVLVASTQPVGREVIKVVNISIVDFKALHRPACYIGAISRRNQLLLSSG